MMHRLSGPDDGKAFRVRRAITGEDLVRAYRLVDGAGLAGNDWRRVTSSSATVHRAVPDTAVFVAESAGEMVGVMALVPDTPDLGLPSDVPFGRELALLREMGCRAAEITHVALAPRGPAVAVLAELFRACFAQAVHAGCNEMFIAAAGRYERLFEEVFQFEGWDMQRRAPSDGSRFYGKRLCLTGLGSRLVEADRRLGPDAFLHAFFFGSNVYHDYVAPWSVMAAGTFRDTAALRHLFVERSVLLDGLTDGQREALRTRWGEVAFDTVLARGCHDLALA